MQNCGIIARCMCMLCLICSFDHDHDYGLWWMIGDEWGGGDEGVVAM